MIRVVIQNEELPNTISTKFNKVESFKLGDLETQVRYGKGPVLKIEQNL